MSNERPSPPVLVRDLMSVGVLTCSHKTPAIDVARVLLERDQEGLVVLNEHGHAVGIVSRANLVQAYGNGDYETLTAEAIMQDGVPQIPPDIPLTAAAQIMQDQGQRILFLMHHAGGIEYPAAFLSYTHLIRHLAMQDVDDLRDLGIKAVRESPLDTFIRRRNEARQQAGLADHIGVNKSGPAPVKGGEVT